MHRGSNFNRVTSFIVLASFSVVFSFNYCRVFMREKFAVVSIIVIRADDD